MNGKLFLQAIVKYISGVIICGTLIFIPAGTLYFWNGWLFMAALFIPMFFAGIVMMFKNPKLLASRLNAKEEENEQKTVIVFSGIMFITGFVICGLNYRFGWMIMPKGVVVAGTVAFLTAYVLYGEVLRENAYLSRTIEVQEGQTVVATGLYGIVRHPMYAVTVILFLAIPVMLGSVYSLIIFLIYPFILVKRIKNEEQVLEKNLEGYREYKEQVKYRMIPFVW